VPGGDGPVEDLRHPAGDDGAAGVQGVERAVVAVDDVAVGALVDLAVDGDDVPDVGELLRQADGGGLRAAEAAGRDVRRPPRVPARAGVDRDILQPWARGVAGGDDAVVSYQQVLDGAPSAGEIGDIDAAEDAEVMRVRAGAERAVRRGEVQAAGRLEHPLQGLEERDHVGDVLDHLEAEDRVVAAGLEEGGRVGGGADEAVDAALTGLGGRGGVQLDAVELQVARVALAEPRETYPSCAPTSRTLIAPPGRR
jgi:hypothetical protein